MYISGTLQDFVAVGGLISIWTDYGAIRRLVGIDGFMKSAAAYARACAATAGPVGGAGFL